MPQNEGQLCLPPSSCLTLPAKWQSRAPWPYHIPHITNHDHFLSSWPWTSKVTFLKLGESFLFPSNGSNRHTSRPGPSRGTAESPVAAHCKWSSSTHSKGPAGQNIAGPLGSSFSVCSTASGCLFLREKDCQRRLPWISKQFVFLSLPYYHFVVFFFSSYDCIQFQTGSSLMVSEAASYPRSHAQLCSHPTPKPQVSFEARSCGIWGLLGLGVAMGRPGLWLFLL